MKRCEICGKRPATGLADLDPADPEVGPQPHIIHICDVCDADPDKAMEEAYEADMREEAALRSELGARVWTALTYENDYELV